MPILNYVSYLKNLFFYLFSWEYNRSGSWMSVWILITVPKYLIVSTLSIPIGTFQDDVTTLFPSRPSIMHLVFSAFIFIHPQADSTRDIQKLQMPLWNVSFVKVTLGSQGLKSLPLSVILSGISAMDQGRTAQKPNALVSGNRSIDLLLCCFSDSRAR